MMQIFSSLGVAGVLAWYLYYTTAVSFPRMHDAALSQMRDLSERQTRKMDEVSERFIVALREERGVIKSEMSMLRDEIRAGTGSSDTKVADYREGRRRGDS